MANDSLSKAKSSFPKDREMRPGKFTIVELLHRTRANWNSKDWARANAKGRPFPGDRGLTYSTTLRMQRPIANPHGIRFQTVTTDPVEFGVDDRGRFPRRHVQYVQLPKDFARTNLRGERRFVVYCSCKRFKFYHHYVLYRNGHAPQPFGAGNAPPVKTNPYMRVGACKHIILALLALQKLSAQNKIPSALPESKWRELELYWQKIEREGWRGPSSVPKRIRDIADEVNRTGKAPSGTPKRERPSIKDFSAKIRPPKRVY